METISLRPIGTIKSPFQNNTPAEEIRSQSLQIVIEPGLWDGLLGLEAGMDILVIFYLDQVNPAEINLQLHPRHDPANPRRGVFATRSQFRPNQLGVSVARIERIAAGIISVRGLDGLDQTPVLDIKPYVPIFDQSSDSQQFEVRRVASLAEARQAIDIIDAEVIRLLGNRAGFVHQVVDYKQTVEEVRAPARYAEVMRRRREMAVAAGLNPEVIEAMYKLLVENFIQEELAILRRREAEQAGQIDELT
jgi:tRNA-Thr(GGU) m(6)t(6)A37 methyltransferase TsaA